MNRELRWVELPTNLDEQPPVEQMELFRTVSRHRPEDSPWIGMVVPLSSDRSYEAISVSLVGSLKFTDAVMTAFAQLAQSIAETLTADESAWIAKDQQGRGDAEQGWSSEEGLLRVVVPVSVERDTREAIEKLLAKFSTPVETTDE